MCQMFSNNNHAIFRLPCLRGSAAGHAFAKHELSWRLVTGQPQVNLSGAKLPPVSKEVLFQSMLLLKGALLVLECPTCWRKKNAAPQKRRICKGQRTESPLVGCISRREPASSRPRLPPPIHALEAAQIAKLLRFEHLAAKSLNPKNPRERQGRC